VGELQFDFDFVLVVDLVDVDLVESDIADEETLTPS
jgi:hypothetical protein